MHRFTRTPDAGQSQPLLTAMIAGALLIAGCEGPKKPQEPIQRHGDEIVVAGQLIRIGTPVVLWDDPGGYNAYSNRCHFSNAAMPSNPASPGNPQRYNDRKPINEALAAAVARDGWTLSHLQQQIDQFVFHYDACGTSRRCFEVLQDIRGLSVHFLLDLDGTIYQTLDVTERAWHAGTANDRSVGIEIANIGAYPDMSTLDEWYARDATGRPYVTFPSAFDPTGIRTPDFVARPARPEVIVGTINQRVVMQYDYTDAQYEALAKLVAAMHRVFKNMALDYPRNPEGGVRWTVFNDAEQAAFRGFMGHLHESHNKVDPGPAFDWHRVMNGARRLAGTGREIPSNP